MPAHRREHKKRRARVRVWAAGCGVYAALLLAGYVVCLGAPGGDRGVLDGRLGETAERTENSNRQINALRPKLAQARLTLAGNRAVGDQPDWSVVLALLAKSLDDDLVLSRCQLRPATSRQTRAGTHTSAASAGQAASKPKQFVLEVSGLGHSQKAVSRFVLRLEQANLFNKVTLVKTNREPLMAGKAISFQVTCLLGENNGTSR